MIMADSVTAGVIVNADDFGRSAGVNAAVVRAHREGVLSSASVLANGAAVGEALRLARDLPGLGLGIHLALTELEPLTHCPQLAPGGRFPATHGQVFRRFLLGQPGRRQLRDELRAQCEAVLASGLPVDHVDGHGHVHVLPAVLEELVPLCEAYGIGAIRWPVELPWGGVMPFGGRLRRGLLAGLCRQGASLVAGLRRPARFFGLMASGRMDTAMLLAAAAAGAGRDGPAEIMVHPAEADEAEYRGYRGRQELEGLCAPEVAAALPPRIRFADLPAVEEE